jgi:L-threonylcarbamoyladenylate synthase
VILQVDPDHPDPLAIDRAARVIRSGGIVAVPTDTLYGLAADPFDAHAVARIFAVKARAAERALPLVAADREQVVSVFGPLSPLGDRLAASFWPGPLTLLVPAPAGLAVDVTGGTGRVGVRVPRHNVTTALSRAAGRPVTATSANRSGEAPAAGAAEVERSLADAIDLILDAGATPGGPPSTIVDTTGPEPRLVRAGAIPWERIERCLRP